MRPIVKDLENISKIIKKEGLQILVVSYGGSSSNTLVTTLEKEGYTCQTDIWNKLICHAPKYISCSIPIIYIYDNPIKSFLSMKRRGKGFYDVNQRKLSNNNDCIMSDENLLKLMIKQFHEWTNIKRDNVLIINTNELFKDEIVNKLNIFLNTKVQHFPIKYIKSKNSLYNIDTKVKKLFEKYKYQINKINNFQAPPASNYWKYQYYKQLFFLYFFRILLISWVILVICKIIIKNFL